MDQYSNAPYNTTPDAGIEFVERVQTPSSTPLEDDWTDTKNECYVPTVIHTPRAPAVEDGRDSSLAIKDGRDPTPVPPKQATTKYAGESIPGDQLQDDAECATFTMRVLQAQLFATYYHHGQTRKNAAAFPYVMHPTHALLIFMAHGGERWKHYTIDLARAILLHDVLEDTRTTENEIREHFGENVLSLIKACSENKTKSKRVRKQDEIDHLAKERAEVKLIKLVDKLSSVSGLFEGEAPKNWSEGEIRGYMHWTYAICCRACAGVLPSLDEHAKALFAKNGIAPTDAELKRELDLYYALLDQTYGETV